MAIASQIAREDPARFEPPPPFATHFSAGRAQDQRDQPVAQLMWLGWSQADAEAIVTRNAIADSLIRHGMPRASNYSVAVVGYSFVVSGDPLPRPSYTVH
jgi:hypothetical protein